MMMCPHCGGELRRMAVSHELLREGYRLTLTNILGWTCRQCHRTILGDRQRAILRALQAQIEASLDDLRREIYA